MKKVLIIEDNEDNMELCSMVLKNKYEIIKAYNGGDGLNKIAELKPDVVLLDISLPDMDGLYIARKIKSSKELKHIPVIALTAHCLFGDRERALSMGFDNYIEKPFEIKRLLQIVAYHTSDQNHLDSKQ